MAVTQAETIQDHLKRMGADDLVGLASSKHLLTSTRLSSSSQKNPSVGVLEEDGKRYVLFGLGDPNFVPVRLAYDDKGNIEGVVVNNGGMSGRKNYSPEKAILEAVIKAACGKPAGRGVAIAALAKAAGATDKYGNCKWGTGLIREAADQDTSNIQSANAAIGAIQNKWQNFFKFEPAPMVQVKAAPLKPR